MAYDKMRVLVVGITGWLGNEIARALIDPFGLLRGYQRLDVQDYVNLGLRKTKASCDVC